MNLYSTNPTPILVSENLLKKISYNQQTLIKSLLDKPEGILSRALTHKTGISNKSDICTLKLRDLLKNEGVEINTKRAGRGQWLWSLQKIEEVKNIEARESS